MIYYGLPSVWRVEELIVDNVKQVVKMSHSR